MARYIIKYETADGEIEKESYETEDSANLRANVIEQRQGGTVIDIEPWSRCETATCDSVPEYGMMFCEQCRG